MVAPSGGGRSPRDKLRRAFRGEAEQRQREQAQREQERMVAPPPGSMRAFLQERSRRLAAGLPAVPPRAVVELPDAEVQQTPHGPLWLRQQRYPLTDRHGEVALGRGTTFDPARIAALARSDGFAALRPDELLFLDTETTGLAGGAGTVVFAYGLGWYERDALVFEQLFLRDFGEEPAMLHHLARRLCERPVPVTFVGKSYDRHRIAARLAVHRVEAPVLTERHLDLYHVIRREYGKRWPDSRLRTAEERLLGLFREHDLPGSEAPAAFLDWIRDRTGPVDRVLEHNRLDVLSLAALLGAVGVAETDSAQSRS